MVCSRARVTIKGDYICISIYLHLSYLQNPPEQTTQLWVKYIFFRAPVATDEIPRKMQVAKHAFLDPKTYEQMKVLSPKNMGCKL